MRTTDRTLHLGPATRSLPLTARLMLAFANVASGWRAIRNRREIHYLNELNDSQLKDIGLTDEQFNRETGPGAAALPRRGQARAVSSRTR